MKIILGLILFCGLAIGAAAQPANRPLTKKQLMALYLNGLAALDKKPYQRKIVSQITLDGPVPRVLTYQWLIESTPDQTKHTTETYSFAENRKVSEWYSIKGQDYRRENDGPWQLFEDYLKQMAGVIPKDPFDEEQQSITGSAELDRAAKIVSGTPAYKDLGEQLTNGETLRRFEVIVSSQAFDGAQKIIWTSQAQTRYWLRADGTPVREETTSDIVFGAKHCHGQGTTTSEIVPALKIEIPVAVREMIITR